jgi:hypothetical protein
MTAQAVAKEMIRWGNGGSIAMIASMSGSVANRVSGSVLNALTFLLTPVRRVSSAQPTTPPKPPSSN